MVLGLLRTGCLGAQLLHRCEGWRKGGTGVREAGTLGSRGEVMSGLELLQPEDTERSVLIPAAAGEGLMTATAAATPGPPRARPPITLTPRQPLWPSHASLEPPGRACRPSAQTSPSPHFSSLAGGTLEPALDTGRWAQDPCPGSWYEVPPTTWNWGKDRVWQGQSLPVCSP